MGRHRNLRLKLTHACDSCRNKKVKCDGQYPKCGNCLTRDLTCTYLTNRKRRGPRNEEFEFLQNRLVQLESLLASRYQRLPPYLELDVNTDLSNNSDNNDPQEKAKEKESQGETETENRTEGGRGGGEEEEENGSSQELPSEELMEHLIHLYFTHVHPSIRFVHRPTFLKRFRAQRQRQGQGQRQPLLLLNSIFCLSARFSEHPQVLSQPRYLAGQVYFLRAVSLINEQAISQPSIETVQALIMLSLYEYGKMNGFASWHYIEKKIVGPSDFNISIWHRDLGIAIRLAQQLGLHVVDSYHHENESSSLFKDQEGRHQHQNQNPRSTHNHSDDWLTLESKRRTWWGCYIADRFASTIVGRSMYIDERDCLVTLPGGDAQWDSHFHVMSKLPPTTEEDLLDFGSDLSGRQDVFCDLSAHFVRLLNLMGKVTLYLLHRTAKGISYDEDLSELLRLDESICDWYKSIPPRFSDPRAFLCIHSKQASDVFRTVSCLFALYHSALISLHRGNLAMAQDTELHVVASISKSKCIESANAITDFVNDAWNRINDLTDPYYPFAVFNAATVHANCAYLEQPPSSLLAHEKLNTTTKCLEYLSSYWKMSQAYLLMLRSIENTLQYANIIGPYAVWVVPCSASYFDWFYSMQAHLNYPLPPPPAQDLKDSTELVNIPPLI